MNFAYKTVLFDADGTLLDFLKSERAAFEETMALQHIAVCEEEYLAYSEINDMLWKRLEKGEIKKSYLLYHRFELLCERYGYTADAKSLSENYLNIIATKGYLLDGAYELLQSLFGKVRMYIITNGAEKVQRGRYKKTEIESFFDGLFISEVIGFYKPDVRFFEYVSTHIDGFDPKSTLVVGDSLTSDIKGGNAFGLDTCWYNPKGAASAGVAVPTYTALDFQEIYNIILGKEDGHI